MQNLTVKELLRTFGEERATVSWLAARRTLEYTFEASQALLRIENVRVKQVTVEHPYDLAVLRLEEPVDVFLTHLSDEQRTPKMQYSLVLKHEHDRVAEPVVVKSPISHGTPAIYWDKCRVGFCGKRKGQPDSDHPDLVYRIISCQIPEHLRTLAGLNQTIIDSVTIHTKVDIDPEQGHKYYDRVVAIGYHYDQQPHLVVTFSDDFVPTEEQTVVARLPGKLRWRCGVLQSPIGMMLDICVDNVWESMTAGIPSMEGWSSVINKTPKLALRRPTENQSELTAKGAQE